MWTLSNLIEDSSSCWRLPENRAPAQKKGAVLTSSLLAMIPVDEALRFAAFGCADPAIDR
jgi:hypothetical protein